MKSTLFLVVLLAPSLLWAGSEKILVKGRDIDAREGADQLKVYASKVAELAYVAQIIGTRVETRDQLAEVDRANNALIVFAEADCRAEVLRGEGRSWKRPTAIHRCRTQALEERILVLKARYQLQF